MYANSFLVKRKNSNPITITAVEMKEWFVPLNFWGNSAKLIFLGNMINPEKEKTHFDK